MHIFTKIDIDKVIFFIQTEYFFLKVIRLMNFITLKNALKIEFVTRIRHYLKIGGKILLVVPLMEYLLSLGSC